MEYEKIKLTKSNVSNIDNDYNAQEELEDAIFGIVNLIREREIELNSDEATYDAAARIEYYNNLVEYYNNLMEVKK